MPNEVSKVENLKLYISGWRAGASGDGASSQMGAYTKGYNDGANAYIAARKQAVTDLCISVDDFLGLVENMEVSS
ncbi:MAG: hypothetical protein EPN91_08215 [Salinibacterium sp.]|nr:MAG: hypothetical protein EPN91_08215 [Salinibacterium sp.]